MILLASQSGRVLIIAHGGAFSPFLANTAEGIGESIAADVDGIEVDVQATRDGELVLLHDSSLRMGRERIKVSDRSFAELAAIFEKRERRRLPRLREVLDRLHGKPSLLVLDIKAGNVIDRVMRLLHAADAAATTLIASFDYLPLVRAKELQPRVPTGVTVGLSRVMTRPLGFLWTLFALFSPVRAALRIDADAILCPAYRLTRRLVRRAHAREIAVLVWDLGARNREDLATYRIDGVVTNSLA